MITLGSLTLNNGLVWEEAARPTHILQEVKRTLGGGMRVYSAMAREPLLITLVSLQDQGWQTYETVKVLREMATVLDGQYTLVYGADTFTVSFRHYDPPVLEATPLLPRSTPEDTDYYTITLRLVSYQ